MMDININLMDQFDEWMDDGLASSRGGRPVNET